MLSISSRHYFSAVYLEAAARLAQRSREIEGNFRPPFSAESAEIWEEDRCYVVGSITSSVAFLEAAINETFCDATDADGGFLRGMNSSDRNRLARFWNLGVPRTARFAILDKYRICDAVLGREAIDTSQGPFQDVKSLVELRNALAHYEPEWIQAPSATEIPQDRQHKFERRLKGKFPLNPIAGAGNPFYPDRCLGYGCASWALKSSLAFADAFFNKLEVNPPHARVRERVRTLAPE